MCYSRPMVIHSCVLASTFLFQAAQPQTPTDPSQMSLAERAAAARKAAAEKAARSGVPRPDGPPPLTPEQRGSIQRNTYVNNFFHFQIDLGAQWEPLDADRTSISLATAHRY